MNQLEELYYLSGLIDSTIYSFDKVIPSNASLLKKVLSSELISQLNEHAQDLTRLGSSLTIIEQQDAEMMSLYQRPFTMIVDTETTGLIKEWKESLDEREGYPYLVQLGFQIYDAYKSLIFEGSYLVKPKDFEIKEDSFQVHGISHDIAMKYGYDGRDVLTRFQNLLSHCDVIVGHNLNFDLEILRTAHFREFGYGKDLFDDKIFFCTQEDYDDYENDDMDEYEDYRSLQQLQIDLLGKYGEVKHNALEDVKVTAKCFWHIVGTNNCSISRFYEPVNFSPHLSKRKLSLDQLKRQMSSQIEFYLSETYITREDINKIRNACNNLICYSTYKSNEFIHPNTQIRKLQFSKVFDDLYYSGLNNWNRYYMECRSVIDLLPWIHFNECDDLKKTDWVSVDIADLLLRHEYKHIELYIYQIYGTFLNVIEELINSPKALYCFSLIDLVDDYNSVISYASKMSIKVREFDWNSLYKIDEIKNEMLSLYELSDSLGHWNAVYILLESINRAIYIDKILNYCITYQDGLRNWRGKLRKDSEDVVVLRDLVKDWRLKIPQDNSITSKQYHHLKQLLEIEN